MTVFWKHMIALLDSDHTYILMYLIIDCLEIFRKSFLMCPQMCQVSYTIEQHLFMIKLKKLHYKKYFKIRQLNYYVLILYINFRLEHFRMCQINYHCWILYIHNRMLLEIKWYILYIMSDGNQKIILQQLTLILSHVIYSTCHVHQRYPSWVKDVSTTK